MVPEDEGLLIPVGKRNNPCGLELFRGLLKLCQCHRNLINSRFLEQILVIDKPIALQVHRLTIQMSVLGHRLLRNRLHILHPRLARQILQVILPHVQFPVASDIENIRFLARGELGPKRSSIIAASPYSLYVQLHTRMLFLILHLQAAHGLGDLYFELKNMHGLRAAILPTA
ncbi:hypothetical protein D3C85_1201070 [compost metagenome]